MIDLSEEQINLVAAALDQVIEHDNNMEVYNCLPCATMDLVYEARTLMDQCQVTINNQKELSNE